MSHASQTTGLASRVRIGVTCAAVMVCGVLSPTDARAAAREVTLYVAPDGRGARDGSGAAAAAPFQLKAFWAGVQERLRHGPVTVRFVDGTYLCFPNVRLKGLGHATHRLTLRGDTEAGAVFRKHRDDPQPRANLFVLDGCTNLLLRDLHFRGADEMGYAFNVRGGSTHVDVERCTWVDLTGAYYGAAGTNGDGTAHVTFRGCTFRRVGSGIHAHMIYNAYGARYVHAIDCTFEDCGGDFVRFRDRTDYCAVINCTFTSTGRYTNGATPYVSVPLFNSRGPGSPEERYEYFGTHFLIAGNRFVYPPGRTEGNKFAVMLYHKGFTPADRQFLFTPADASALKTGTTADRKALLRDRCGIDTDQIRVFDNTYRNPTEKVVFGTFPGYGSEDLGWEGFIPIFDLLNHAPVSLDDPEIVELFQLRR